PNESAKLFKNRRSREEVLKYLLVFGGVPKYLEEINLKQSFNQNMNSLCFSVNSSMIKEIDKIFYAQFRDAEIYVQIVRLLRDSLLTHTEIAAKCGKKSGGSLKKILQHLEDAEIIRAHFTFDRNWNAKYKKYKLSDEYLTFFFKYMNPYLKTIAAGEQSKLFEMMVESSFSVWLGFAFEKFCLKHAFYLAEKMGFADQVIAYAPYFRKEDEGFQIDLIYKRVDKVITICEMKYHAKPIGVSVVKEMERKINLLKKPRGFTVEKALISLYGPDKHLESMGYFDYSLTIDDIIDGAN
ncbi:hypothetical protein KAH37_09355, partial [bacterium]|nr:hypothetical protein [bacterium]